jgi:actin-binding protein anillin
VAECEFDENGKMIRKGETVNSLSNFENNPVQLRDQSRKNLKRLGALYSDTDQISSPIQRTEENFCEMSNTGNSSRRPIKKFSKLTELANDINSWDDDYSHHQTLTTKVASSPKKIYGGRNNNTNVISSPANTDKSRISNVSSPKARKDSIKSSAATISTTSSSPKKLMWDKKVIDSLEAQGFARRETSGPKLVYDYSKDKPLTSGESCPLATTVSSPAKKTSFAKPAEKPTKEVLPKITPSSSSLSSRSEQKNVRFSNKFSRDGKDPAEMSLKERMAIFEKNKGKAPVPRTQFGITDANPIRTHMPELTKKFDFGFKASQNKKASAPPQITSSSEDSVIDNATVNIKSAVSKLLAARETTISEKQINDNVRKQREEDMKCIMKRYNNTEEQQDISNEDDGDETMYEEKSERKRLSSSSEKTPIEKKIVGVVQKLDDKKRARVSNPQRLYPVLSDIETTDSEIDNYTTATVSCSEENIDIPESSTRVMNSSDDEDESTNASIGHTILKTIRKSNDLSNHSYLESTVSSVDASDAMCEIDEYLNEALDDSKDYDDKGSACSDSFEYERYPKRVSFKEPARERDEIPIKSRLEISPAKTPDGSMTLVHTVSFYRRQQSASASNTPIKKVVHHKTAEVGEDESTKTARKAKEEASNKIQRLLDEIMRQQTIISQTSQALNLCASTVEFSGSTEAVEGERHLLVATHRRLACLNEVQRLKVEGVTDRIDAPKEKGTLTIQEIIIPLKQTYINRLATDEINGHHLLCLVKYNEYVLATKTLPTLPGLKSVKFTDILSFNEIYADFKVSIV